MGKEAFYVDGNGNKGSLHYHGPDGNRAAFIFDKKAEDLQGPVYVFQKHNGEWKHWTVNNPMSHEVKGSSLTGPLPGA